MERQVALITLPDVAVSTMMRSDTRPNSRCGHKIKNREIKRREGEFGKDIRFK